MILTFLTHPDTSYPEEGTVRLNHLGRIGTLQGRVEVFHKAEWGTVCDDVIGKEHVPRAICYMLGHAYGKKVNQKSSASGAIWMEDVKCKGREINIWECEMLFDPKQGIACTHENDLHIFCT